MCGIVGIVNFSGEKVETEKLVNMNNILYHRGPDCGNIFLDNNIGLGHRRLSIVDLSEIANQPMNYKNTPFWIVYNGEVYNYLELKKELESRGYRFYTESDTEVVLVSYIEWGEECFHKFNGMWALAIYDSQHKEIIICRDRYGIKPLYYYLDNKKFIFASEKKAIVLSEFVDLRFDEKGIKTALFSPFLLEASGNTEFEFVKNLLPGHLIRVTMYNNKVILKRWYNLLENLDKEIPSSFEERVEKFRFLFTHSCRLRLRADVSIATSLSGGLDSSSVVATISKIGNKDYTTFAHSFEGSSLDEFNYAKIVASTTKSHLVEVKQKKDPFDIDKILYYFESIYLGMPDSPYRIYKAQHENRYKVSIDGHGADEMLGGYPWYIDEMLKDIYLLDFIKIYELLCHKRKITLDKKARDSFIVLKFIFNRLPYRLKFFLSKIVNKRKENNKNKSSLEIYRIPDSNCPEGFSNFRRRLFEDFSITILPRILKNFDVLSMANSVEVRMPFLDYRLVQYVFNLPDSDLINKGWTKLILRHAMNGILDERVRWRKDKKGFNSPIAEILSNELKDWAIETIKSADSNLFNREELLSEFKEKILKNKYWGDSLEVWKKINAIKLIQIFREKKGLWC